LISSSLHSSRLALVLVSSLSLIRVAGEFIGPFNLEVQPNLWNWAWLDPGDHQLSTLMHFLSAKYFHS
jgi:hypothetical protein